MPEPWSGPRRFDIDARGVLWIPAYATNELVRLDPATRQFTRFPLPGSRCRALRRPCRRRHEANLDRVFRVGRRLFLRRGREPAHHLPVAESGRARPPSGDRLTNARSLDRLRRVTRPDPGEDRAPSSSLGARPAQPALSPRGRRHTELAAERAREMALIAEPGSDRDLGDARVALAEALGGPHEP